MDLNRFEIEDWLSAGWYPYKNRLPSGLPSPVPPNIYFIRGQVRRPCRTDTDSAEPGVVINDGVGHLSPRRGCWRVSTFSIGKLPKYVFDFWRMAKTLPKRDKAEPGFRSARTGLLHSRTHASALPAVDPPPRCRLEGYRDSPAACWAARGIFDVHLAARSVYTVLDSRPLRGESTSWQGQRHTHSIRRLR
jgi:hypothetical protein